MSKKLRPLHLQAPTMTDPPHESTTSFYNLLFSDSDQFQTLTDDKTSVNDNISPDYSGSFYGPNPPKMLCFGGYKKEEEAICSEITAAATFKQMACQSESSSASSAINIIKTSSNPNRKRNGSGQTLVNGSVDLVNGALESKRGKSDKTAAAVAHAKPRTRTKPVRKEKIGERIATLQQLVSPFGKTDTASVLHEATCYIKFLHDQIQVLSSPYLHQLTPNQEWEGLKSRGLCLVPVAYTAEVATANGADYWAPAALESRSNNVSEKW